MAERTIMLLIIIELTSVDQALCSGWLSQSALLTMLSDGHCDDHSLFLEEAADT